jgi:hypothetical protein
VGCHLYHNSTFRYMSKCFLEEDGGEQVIHMVCSRWVLCQRWVPGWFRDRRTDPTRCAQLRVWNNLDTHKEKPTSCYCILIDNTSETGTWLYPIPLLFMEFGFHLSSIFIYGYLLDTCMPQILQIKIKTQNISILISTWIFRSWTVRISRQLLLICGVACILPDPLDLST